MHVRLFGSLEIENGDGPVWVGGQQRRVLISLALESHGLHREVLEDRLGLSRGGLRTAVTRLRAAVGSEALASVENSYRLDFDSIDTNQFEAMLREANAQRATERAETLHNALGLWRGSALQDVADEEWARPAAVRLNELRVAASEDLAEALVETERTTGGTTGIRPKPAIQARRDGSCHMRSGGDR